MRTSALSTSERTHPWRPLRREAGYTRPEAGGEPVDRSGRQGPVPSDFADDAVPQICVAARVRARHKKPIRDGAGVRIEPYRRVQAGRPAVRSAAAGNASGPIRSLLPHVHWAQDPHFAFFVQ